MFQLAVQYGAAQLEVNAGKSAGGAGSQDVRSFYISIMCMYTVYNMYFKTCSALAALDLKMYDRVILV